MSTNNIELTTKQRGKITRAVKALNDVRQELQDENPGININWYLEDSDNLNLMGGESHTDDLQHPLQENVIELLWLKNASGGGW